MARRDVDVVIGARTDGSSFRTAEQKTQSFLSRLKSGMGGGASDVSTLERSQRILGQVAAVTAVVTAMREAANIMAVATDFAAARSAEIKGNFEAAANAYRKGFETLRSGTISGPAVQLFEQIETLISGEDKLEDMFSKFDQANAKNLASQAKALARLAQIEAAQQKIKDIGLSEFRTRERAAVGDDERDLAVFDTRKAGDDRLKELSQLRSQVAAMPSFGDQDSTLAAIDRTAQAVIENTAAAIDEIDAKFDALDQKRLDAAQKQIDALMLANDAEARLSGVEGKDREIEFIRLRTEARERELQTLMEAAETQEQRVQIEKVLADVRTRSDTEIAEIRDRPEKPGPRPGLASASDGLLVSGFADASRAGQSFQAEQKRIAENTRDNTKETTAILAQLLEVTKGRRDAPILN